MLHARPVQEKILESKRFRILQKKCCCKDTCLN
uniref:Uncharacterized protein n=1 Tax=Rhizophora mucronata TaxID=61149 RepID=A0A2P2QDX4_RHIMU